ncbi:helix-turn-helix domain-containing protein [Psychrobacillus sp. FSL H8-0484]|uniref:helix-turn-helix transcriptional regulator n=1 Tax=Psychrobacillus sp. FSL H8-0484 TaxID=2921390 RepID=UPI0030F58782
MELNLYIPIVEFLEGFLGPEADIVLFDTKKEEAIFVNALNRDFFIGSPIREIEQKFIKQEIYVKQNSVLNYRAFSSERKKLRSASYFIKDSNNELIGILTINYKVDGLLELRNTLNNLISGTKTSDIKEEEYYESFNLSFEDLMTTTIQDSLNKFNVPPDRLSHDEKLEVIRSLDEKGTFLIKGSVIELAKVLNTSETSIYRYINKL